MIEIVVVALAIAGTIIVRVVRSVPPRAVGALPGPTAFDMAVPQTTATIPTAHDLLGTPAMPDVPAPVPLPAPDFTPALVGVDHDHDDDRHQLWLVARERLARRR